MAQQTAKEKAINLVHKFCSTTDGYYKSKKNLAKAKQCALIAINEIMNLDDISAEGREYWKEVKQQWENI
jgi:hypothetical protein